MRLPSFSARVGQASNLLGLMKLKFNGVYSGIATKAVYADDFSEVKFHLTEYEICTINKYHSTVSFIIDFRF